MKAVYLSAILNGLAAPPLILLMLLLSRDARDPEERELVTQPRMRRRGLGW